jgi:hypothetical protein
MALVPIVVVQVDPPSQPDPTRKRYRVRLACGCTWWEYHRNDLEAPLPGQTATCFAAHRASNAGLRKEAPLAASPMHRSPVARL